MLVESPNDVVSATRQLLATRGPGMQQRPRLGCGRIGLSGGEGQTFWAVRRHRLQALTFATLPSVTRVIG
ncbi:hypothetical protein BH23CHL9_BH23CHL9_12560 [soil metagenome]